MIFAGQHSDVIDDSHMSQTQAITPTTHHVKVNKIRCHRNSTLQKCCYAQNERRQKIVTHPTVFIHFLL